MANLLFGSDGVPFFFLLLLVKSRLIGVCVHLFESRRNEPNEDILVLGRECLKLFDDNHLVDPNPKPHIAALLFLLSHALLWRLPE